MTPQPLPLLVELSRHRRQMQTIGGVWHDAVPWEFVTAALQRDPAVPGTPPIGYPDLPAERVDTSAIPPAVSAPPVTGRWVGVSGARERRPLRAHRPVRLSSDGHHSRCDFDGAPVHGGPAMSAPMTDLAALTARVEAELPWWESRKWGDQGLRLHAESVATLLRDLLTYAEQVCRALEGKKAANNMNVEQICHLMIKLEATEAQVAALTAERDALREKQK